MSVNDRSWFREHGGAVVTALATVIAAIIAVWANRQVTDANTQRDIEASRAIALEAGLADRTVQIAQMKARLDELQRTVPRKQQKNPAGSGTLGGSNVGVILSHSETAQPSGTDDVLHQRRDVRTREISQVTWEHAGLTVLIDEVDQRGDEVALVMLFKNDSAKRTRTLSAASYRLIDNLGNEWIASKAGGSVTPFGIRLGGVNIAVPPGTIRRQEFTFKCSKCDAYGTTVSITDGEGRVLARDVSLSVKRN
jgi:hypothetical protein